MITSSVRARTTLSSIRLIQRVGWGIASACLLVALVRAGVAEHPAPARRLDAAGLSEVGRLVAQQEQEWRRSALALFPGDQWSQDDDFHNSERRWAEAEARRRDVPLSDIFAAIDAQLRAHPPAAPGKATASPSKPRPFYD
jgi:hypothetical protein